MVNKYFFLVTWKQFNDRKMEDKSDIINSEDIDSDLDKFKQMNAQKRLTTTDYRIYNLTVILGDHALKILEDVKK